MTPSEEVVKIVTEPRKDGEAPIVCKKCGHYHTLDVSLYRASGEQACMISIQCGGCGIPLDVLVNFRRMYRKAVNLRGVFWHEEEKPFDSSKGNNVHEMTVENISKYGIGFHMGSPIEIHVDDVLHVRFKIKTAVRVTVVEKRVIVKRVSESFVGVEFIHPVDERDKELAFFLLA